MKTKIFLGILALAVGFNLTSCDDDDDDFSISTSAVLSSSSVVTGSADVTATTADLHATISGNLDTQSSSAYTIGFEYGLAEDALTETASGTYDSGSLSASLSDLTTNTTYYYRAYVCLQSKVYYRGEIKSFVTTNAKSVTGEARDVDFCSAVLAGSQTDAPSDATVGFVISTKSAEEDVRAGLIIPYSDLADSYSLTYEGLMSGTTYYYASYIDLGSGIVYGDVMSFTTEDASFAVDDDFVDLGLSVKWAKKNLGAKTETDLGGLFGFGDLGGVNPSIETSEYAAADIYKTENDAVYLASNGLATLPSASNFEELYSMTTHEWTEQDGVKGLLFTASNGNTLFLPAAGSRAAQTTSEEGTRGLYATGSVNSSNTSYAVSYQFTESVASRTTTPVYQALSVRPIIDGYTATLVTCGSNWNWQEGTAKVYPGQNAIGQYEITVNTTQTDGMIFYIDIANFAVEYPNAIVVVDDILLDGTSVAYDQNKFYFGDIEGKGNYRIEMANTYGSTAYDSPFTKGNTFPDGAGESALAYNESVTVIFSVLSLDAATYTPQLATINSSWGGTWGYGSDSFTLSLNSETHKYEISETDFSIKYEPTDGVDYSGGSIMTFINTNNLYGDFPQAHMTFKSLYLDGEQVTPSDESLIVNSNDGTSHRLELWNMYGTTGTTIGCAFGKADSNGLISELGFKSSMQVDFTVDYLFKTLE